MHALTWHTGGPYAAAAQRLVEGAQAHGLTVDCHVLPDLGSWSANLLHKTALVRAYADLRQLPLLYLDADCVPGPAFNPRALECLMEPGQNAVDLVIRPAGTGGECNAGVFLLGDSARAQGFAERWDEANRRYGYRYVSGDQGCLPRVLRSVPNLRRCALPAAYNHMPRDGDAAGAALTHTKLSRSGDEQLREWRKERLLEQALTQRTVEFRLQPVEGDVVLEGPGALVPAALRRWPVWGVDCVPEGASVVLVERQAVQSLLALRMPSLPAVVMAPALFADGSLAVKLLRDRALFPEAHSVNRLPPALHLYHRRQYGPFLVEHDELPGDSLWHAAVALVCCYRSGRQGTVWLAGCPILTRVQAWAYQYGYHVRDARGHA